MSPSGGSSAFQEGLGSHLRSIAIYGKPIRTILQINLKFLVYLPDEKSYKGFDLAAELDKYTKIGDQARVSQLLQADVSQHLFLFLSPVTEKNEKICMVEPRIAVSVEKVRLYDLKSKIHTHM